MLKRGILLVRLGSSHLSLAASLSFTSDSSQSDRLRLSRMLRALWAGDGAASFHVRNVAILVVSP